VDKAEKARMREEAKQKRLKESMTRQLWGKMTATTGLGANEVAGAGRKRKRAEDDDNSEITRSPRISIVFENTGPIKAPVASKIDCL